MNIDVNWIDFNCFFFVFNSRTHCTLHNYIISFTRDVFLSQIHVEMSEALDEATRKLDLFKSFTPTDSNLNIKAVRPLLQVRRTKFD